MVERVVYDPMFFILTRYDTSGIRVFDGTTIEGNPSRAPAVRWEQAQQYFISKAGKI